MDEFVPLDHFNRIAKGWWVVTGCILIGALLAFVFHTLQPPLYEATATLYAAIDNNKMPDIKSLLPKDQYQYQEDIALQSVDYVMRDQNVLNAVVQQASGQGIQLTTDQLLENVYIERKHGIWVLHYRSSKPKAAQYIANTWIESGYQALINNQKSGQIKEFVVFSPPNPARLPGSPAIFDRNKLMLAGALLGFIAGILLADHLPALAALLSKKTGTQ